MIKRITAILLLCIMSVYSVCSAQENITVTVNGQAVEFDVPPQIINDRTMLPMRKIFEALGAEIEWIESSQAIIAAKGSLIITLRIGYEDMSATDILTGETKKITLDSVPVILEERTLVPVRAVSEAFGLKVNWDADTSEVSIVNQE